jgi:IS5 family transposase
LWEKHWLKKVKELVNWVGFQVRIEKLYNPDEGRPAEEPVMLFRCLLLAQWYGLSDRQLEEALEFRIDFRKFVGLSYGEAAPDHSTFSVFRGRIERIWKKLLQKMNEQLEKAGYKIKEAIAVDATLVEAYSKPQGTRKAGDPEASWRGFPAKKLMDSQGNEAVARRPALYGYKINLSGSVKEGFVGGLKVTKASEHETHHFREFIGEETEEAYGDKGYVRHRKYLRRKGIRDGIQVKAVRGKALGRADTDRNKRITKKRRFIEGVFGSWKQWYGWHKTKYVGLVRNQLAVTLTAIAWNMKKWAALAA